MTALVVITSAICKPVALAVLLFFGDAQGSLPAPFEFDDFLLSALVWQTES